MKFIYEHFSLTQLGEVFGVSSHQVGKWLVAIGLRTDAMRPSREAFSGGYVTTAPSRGQGYNYVWHADKTTKTLIDAGHQVSLKPGSALLAPCRLNGPFEYRPHADIGYEIANHDGTVAVWVTGKENAAFLCRLLNSADRHRIVERSLGTAGSPRREDGDAVQVA